MRNHRGASVTEYALVLMLVGVPACLILSALLSTPAAQQMASLAEQGVSNIAADISVAAPATDMSVSHAAKHGVEAINAQQCFDKYGVYQQWHRAADGYKANVCFQGTQFFIQIVDAAGREVTKFERKIARSLSDVGNYLKQSGYVK